MLTEACCSPVPLMRRLLCERLVLEDALGSKKTRGVTRPWTTSTISIEMNCNMNTNYEKARLKSVAGSTIWLTLTLSMKIITNGCSVAEIRLETCSPLRNIIHSSTLQCGKSKNTATSKT